MSEKELSARDVIEKHIEKVMGVRMKYLEMMAAAFVLHTDVPANECELVEQRHDDGKTSWHFRKRPTGGQS